MSQQHHDPEGKSVAAWTGTTVVLLGFLLGAIALPMNLPPLFWVGVVLVVLGGVLGYVLTSMGYGVGGRRSKV